MKHSISLLQRNIDKSCHEQEDEFENSNEHPAVERGACLNDDNLNVDYCTPTTPILHKRTLLCTYPLPRPNDNLKEK